MDIIPIGRPKKRQSILRDKPDNVTLTEWIALKEKQRKDMVNEPLDGLTYERDPESP